MIQRPPSFAAYLATLVTSPLPDPSQWPEPELLDALSSTNLGAILADVKTSLLEKLAFLERVREFYSSPSSNSSPSSTIDFNLSDIPPANVISLETLAWARAHYLSRRYPGSFSLDKNLVDAVVDTEVGVDGREVGMSNMGTLSPLLDILNHSSEKNWLKLHVSDGFLCVDANEPVPKGGELLSNYGSDKSNEQLLFAYGFATKDNPADSVALKMMGGGKDADGQGDRMPARYLGTFYLNRGGLDGVPRDLWEILSRYGWDEGDKDDLIESREGGDEEQIAVGLEECLLLRDFLTHKLGMLEATEHLCLKLFSAPNSEGITSSKKRLRDGAGPTRECSDHRPLYIKFYRDGQREIIREVLESLHEIIEEGGEEEEEGGEL